MDTVSQLIMCILTVCIIQDQCHSQSTTCSKTARTCSDPSDMDAISGQLLMLIQDLQARVESIEKYVKPATYINGTSNLAIGKPAFQSSTWKLNGTPLVAAFAIDRCSHTLEERTPWWAVDLQKRERVYRVELRAVGDREIYAARLRNVYVGMTDISPEKVAPNLYNFKICTFSQAAFSSGETRVLDCEVEFVEGRFLVVQTDVTDYLTLCSVKVYGKVSQP